MGFFSIKSNGGLIKHLQERASKLTGGVAPVRLTVPPELFWWKIQEVGSTGYYPIDPVNASKLIFPKDGEVIRSEHVNHPPVKPRRMVSKVEPTIKENTANFIREALLNGGLDDPALIEQAILRAMEDAKEQIVASIEKELPGTREYEAPVPAGRLGGRTAAEVFNELSTIVTDKE